MTKRLARSSCSSWRCALAVSGASSASAWQREAAPAGEHRSTQQKLLDGGRQAQEDLLHQVIGDKAMAAAEGVDEARQLVAVAHRQRRELQPRNPAFGTCLQRGEHVLGQGQTEQLDQEPLRLLATEA